MPEEYREYERRRSKKTHKTKKGNPLIKKILHQLLFAILIFAAVFAIKFTAPTKQINTLIHGIFKKPFSITQTGAFISEALTSSTNEKEGSENETVNDQTESIE